MQIRMSSSSLLFFLFISTCFLLISEGKGGRGGGGRGRGGGSRGGSSRTSSSRGSSSSSSGGGHISSSSSTGGRGHISSSSSTGGGGHYSSTSGGGDHISSSSSSRGGGHYASSSRGSDHYDRSGSSSGRAESKYLDPLQLSPPQLPSSWNQPPSLSRYEPSWKSTVPEVVRQPAVNPNFKEWNPNQSIDSWLDAYRLPAHNLNYKYSSPEFNQQPPPFSTRENHDPLQLSLPRLPPSWSQPPPPSRYEPSWKLPVPEVIRQPAMNPSFKEWNPNQSMDSWLDANRLPSHNTNYKYSSPEFNKQPPPYSPRENPPPYSLNQGALPPLYNPYGSPNVRQQPGEAPPPYSGRGIQGANYPRQTVISGGNHPQQGGGNYTIQPGTFGQPGVGIPSANYPRQTYYPPNTLGSNVWQPQSGRPAPAYMNYGGLPTGSNMYSKPEKKKGFLGSLISMGSHKHKKNKYLRSQPNPFGMDGIGGMEPMGGGFMGKHGSKAAMHTILPYMDTRKSSKFFRPRFGYHPIFWHRPSRHHYGHYSHTHYDVYNNEYVGRCNRPLVPDHGKVACYSTRNEVDCDVTCEAGYFFPDNTTRKSNKCWHVTGVWKPMKNFQGCQPVCNRTCLNGGTCIGPDICRCPPEYRGLQCEFYFLKCDVRKLANGAKITWVCTHSKNETICKVKCEDSLLFPTPIEEVYTCSPDGAWTSNSTPKCVSFGPPDPVRSCLVMNYTSDSMRIECQEGNNGGLRQEFYLEVYSEEHEYLKNLTSLEPVFQIQDLKAENVYVLVIYAANARGRSPSVTVLASTEIPTGKN